MQIFYFVKILKTIITNNAKHVKFLAIIYFVLYYIVVSNILMTFKLNKAL